MELNGTVLRRLAKGSMIILKDAASLSRVVTGVTYEVLRTIEVPESRGLMTWVFIEAQDNTVGENEPTVWFLVKIVDSKLDLRLMQRAPGFKEGNRADMIGPLDQKWLFQKPENTDDFVLNNLVYTDTLDWPHGQRGAFTYSKKPQGDLAGEPIERPRPSGDFPKQLATVVEYIAEAAEVPQPSTPSAGGRAGRGAPVAAPTMKVTPKFPEAVLFENGPEADDNGGLIWLLIGHQLNLDDVDVLPATK